MKSNLFFPICLLLLIGYCSIAQPEDSKILSLCEIEIENLSFNEDLGQVDSLGKFVFSKNYFHLNNLKIIDFFYLSDGLKIRAFIIKPKGDSDKLPAIIFNRGGNKNYGNLSPAMLIYNLSVIASKGYVIIGSTYRGNDESEGLDEFAGNDVNDVVNLVSLLPTLKFIDSSRIALFGWSRGGLMTYQTLKRLKQSKQIKTAIIGSTPSDLVSLVKERPDFESNVLEKLIPDYRKNKIHELRKRSVIYWTNELPHIPLLLIHGLNDKRVNVDQVLSLSQNFVKNNIPFKLIIYENEGHNIKHNKSELDFLVLKWLEKYL